MFPYGSDGLRSRITGNDAIAILELIGICLAGREEKAFRALFPKIQELFPFDFAIAALGTHEGNQETLSAYPVNVSFPDEWLLEYQAKDYLRDDSVVLENFKCFQVQTWSLARKDIFRKQEITSLGLDFGLRECCTHGVNPGVAGNRGSMFCFAGSSITFTARHRAILEILIPHLHLALSDIARKKIHGKRDVVLSSREREVLDWLKQGKSSWEISAILKISERTVNFHVGNILRKLQVVNRAQAVAVAVRSGLIDVN
jgi:DNA-binding CsgD family transcriptional regulator